MSDLEGGIAILDGITLYSTLYYERSIYKGSFLGVNFHIGKAGADEHPVLEVKVWKGPYILEKTEEEIFTKEFPFSDEGIAAAGDWIGEQQKWLCPSRL